VARALKPKPRWRIGAGSVCERPGPLFFFAGLVVKGGYLIGSQLVRVISSGVQLVESVAGASSLSAWEAIFAGCCGI